MAVVAAVDRSDQAKAVVREAESLATAFEEDLYVVHVMTRSEFTDIQRNHTEETGTAVDMETISKLAAEYAEEATVDIDVPHESLGLVGDPSSRVIEFADERDARYIVTGGRKRSPTGKAVFGSVSQSIILNADTTVVSTVGK
ncbi:Nucleotide-binding universal stress protein, UspA family [Natronorubrum sediminis]|uniref:Nucleotide-binding universal stress protein, UspA family n=1 Tax=Natronorubrum sediminis TaxID=640943 RepID=A0A1H6FUA3_9EURY|nr:universal stress protein [Natronorubrum sediminis]SEH13563.1 Nucleotide-binding universal stress protein, UspA family [Natronorubrum sediminis]